MTPEAKARRRANRKQMDRNNVYGKKDLTPYNVERRMNGKSIVYK